MFSATNAPSSNPFVPFHGSNILQSASRADATGKSTAKSLHDSSPRFHHVSNPRYFMEHVSKSAEHHDNPKVLSCEVVRDININGDRDRDRGRDRDRDRDGDRDRDRDGDEGGGGGGSKLHELKLCRGCLKFFQYRPCWKEQAYCRFIGLEYTVENVAYSSCQIGGCYPILEDGHNIIPTTSIIAHLQQLGQVEQMRQMGQVERVGVGVETREEISQNENEDGNQKVNNDNNCAKRNIDDNSNPDLHKKKQQQQQQQQQESFSSSSSSSPLSSSLSRFNTDKDLNLLQLAEQESIINLIDNELHPLLLASRYLDEENYQLTVGKIARSLTSFPYNYFLEYKEKEKMKKYFWARGLYHLSLESIKEKSFKILSTIQILLQKNNGMEMEMEMKMYQKESFPDASRNYSNSDSVGIFHQNESQANSSQRGSGYQVGELNRKENENENESNQNSKSTLNFDLSSSSLTSPPTATTTSWTTNPMITKVIPTSVSTSASASNFKSSSKNKKIGFILGLDYPTTVDASLFGYLAEASSDLNMLTVLTRFPLLTSYFLNISNRYQFQITDNNTNTNNIANTNTHSNSDNNPYHRVVKSPPPSPISNDLKKVNRKRLQLSPKEQRKSRTESQQSQRQQSQSEYTTTTTTLDTFYKYSNHINSMNAFNQIENSYTYMKEYEYEYENEYENEGIITTATTTATVFINPPRILPFFAPKKEGEIDLVLDSDSHTSGGGVGQPGRAAGDPKKKTKQGKHEEEQEQKVSEDEDFLAKKHREENKRWFYSVGVVFGGLALLSAPWSYYMELLTLVMLSSGEYDDKEEEEEEEYLYEYEKKHNGKKENSEEIDGEGLEVEERGMFDSQEANSGTTGTVSQEASTGVNLNESEPNRDRD